MADPYAMPGLTPGDKQQAFYQALIAAGGALAAGGAPSYQPGGVARANPAGQFMATMNDRNQAARLRQLQGLQRAQRVAQMQQAEAAEGRAATQASQQATTFGNQQDMYARKVAAMDLATEQAAQERRYLTDLSAQGGYGVDGTVNPLPPSLQRAKLLEQFKAQGRKPQITQGAQGPEIVNPDGSTTNLGVGNPRFYVQPGSAPGVAQVQPSEGSAVINARPAAPGVTPVARSGIPAAGAPAVPSGTTTPLIPPRTPLKMPAIVSKAASSAAKSADALVQSAINKTSQIDPRDGLIKQVPLNAAEEAALKFAFDDLATQQKAQAKAIRQMPGTEEAFKNSLLNHANLVTMVNDAEKLVSGWSTGGVGAVMGSALWPGTTEAKALDQKIHQISSNLGLDALLRLKAAGGTMGALSNQELEVLKSTVANLKTMQEPEDIVNELTKLRGILTAYQKNASLRFNQDRANLGLGPIEQDADSIYKAYGITRNGD